MQGCESFLRSMKARLGEILDDASGLFHMVTEDTDPSEAAVASSGLQSFWHRGGFYGRVGWDGFQIIQMRYIYYTLCFYYYYVSTLQIIRH